MLVTLGAQLTVFLKDINFYIGTTHYYMILPTVLPAKSDNDIMFCLQSYQGLRIDRSLVY